MASPGIGTRTDEDSTNAMAPPSVSSAASARLSRTAPRKTLPNAACQASSGTSVAGPGGGPPTLISAPSSRPNSSRAAAMSGRGGGVGVVGGQPHRPPGTESLRGSRRGRGVAAAHHHPRPLGDQGPAAA